MSLPRLIDYSVETLYIDKIFVSVAFMHNASLFFKVLYDNEKSTELPISSQFRKILYYITITTVASFSIFNISQILAVFEFVFDSYGCKNITTTGAVTYYFSVYLSWIFSLVRLMIVFHKKSSITFGGVGYSSCFLKTVTCLVTLDLIILIWLTIYTVNSTVASIPNGMRYCDVPTGGNPLIGLAFANLGVAPTIGCFYLFYRKMRLLEVNIFKKVPEQSHGSGQVSPNSENTTPKRVSFVIHGLDDKKTEAEFAQTKAKTKTGRPDYEMVYVVRKYAVLSAASIISSWAGLFFIMCTSLSFAALAFDTIINCWCIVLFDKRYDSIYKKIFACVSVAKKIKLYKIQTEISLQSTSNISVQP